MSNLRELESIKLTLNSLVGKNPKGLLLEAQAETQVIIAEESIKINENLLKIITILKRR